MMLEQALMEENKKIGNIGRWEYYMGLLMREHRGRR